MRYALFLSFLVCYQLVSAQSATVDSLMNLIDKATTDTAKINIRNKINREMQSISLDTAYAFAQQTIVLSKKANYIQGEAEAHRILAGILAFKSNPDKAKQELSIAEHLLHSANDTSSLNKIYMTYGLLYGIESKYDSSNIFYHKSLELSERQRKTADMNTVYQNLAVNYQMLSNFRMALYYQNKALQLSKAQKDITSLAYINLNMALVYDATHNNPKMIELLQAAIVYAQKAGIRNVEQYAYANLATAYASDHNTHKSYLYAMKAYELGSVTGDQGITASSLSRASIALADEGKYAEAEKLNTKAKAIADSAGHPLNIFQTLNDRGYIEKVQKKYAEAIPFFEQAFAVLKDADLYNIEVGTAYKNLSQCYEATGNYEKALKTYKLSSTIMDSVGSRENVRKATESSMNYDFEKREQIAKANHDKETAIAEARQLGLLIGLVLTVAMVFIIVYAYRQKQKTNKELENQKSELQQTLANLKATQKQLVQSEKMASLGELTAGIAHEIQNPLNFVNNFSEVSAELMEEMEAELQEGNTAEAFLLAKDIKENLSRIVHHGKRADAIVKGMLQHSRSNSGEKEPVSINAFIEEYLRLSYHGMRAKNNAFTATLQTSFDKNIPTINVLPQDIGRTLLNFFNNALYAVNEKKKFAGADYQPTVSVKTHLTENMINIDIEDNGIGIPRPCER